MDMAKVALSTLPRGSLSLREGVGMCIWKWGCWADKGLKQESLLYPVDIKAKDSFEEFINQSYEMATNTFFMPSEDEQHEFYRPWGCISYKSLQTVALK